MPRNQAARDSRRARRATKHRNQRIALGIVAVLILAVAAFFAYQNFAKPKTVGDIPAVNAPVTTTSSGLKYQDIVLGDGQEAKAGDTVSVHYTGWLESDGTKFDSSVDRGTPFEFQLGAGGVIAGWDEGVAGMKAGGKRRLTIPSDLGYGASGRPPVIPANANLIFDVELLEIK